MKPFIIILLLQVLTISGQYRRRPIYESMDGITGNFTSTKVDARFQITRVMELLDFPGWMVGSAQLSNDPVTVELKMLKTEWPEVSVEVLHHNPMADPTPHIFSDKRFDDPFQKPTILTLKDGRKYFANFVAEDAETIAFTAKVGTFKCDLKYAVKKDGAKGSYQCSKPTMHDPLDIVIEYKWN